MRTVSAGALASLLLTGCQSSSQTGTLEVAWSAYDRSGEATLPGRAWLCAESGIVELIAVRGDTGAGLVLFPPDSSRIAPGSYPVFTAGLVTEPRPGANVALRVFSLATVDAYHGLRGFVRVDSSRRGTLSGSLEASLEGIERPDSLYLSGRFDRVLVDTGPAGCGSQLRRNRS